MDAYASASPPSNPMDEPATAAARPLSPEESALLGNALMFDPNSYATTAPARSLRLPGLSQPKTDINGANRPDGSTTVVVKQPLATEWDTSVGADLGSAAPSSDSFQPGRPMPGARDARGSGAAWASVGVPNLATVDARVDPSNDQGKFGTTFKQPLGSRFAVTLQNNYSVTETYNNSVLPGPADVPLMTAPRVTTATPAPQIWGTERAAKFDFLPTGTSFGASFASASNDPVTHRTLSADQKLYGPLHVTTAVTDVGQPTESKSITAGVKLNW
jgi:hypothetical protein